MGIRKDKHKATRRSLTGTMILLEQRTNKHLLILSRRITKLSARVRDLERRLDDKNSSRPKC